MHFQTVEKILKTFFLRQKKHLPPIQLQNPQNGVQRASVQNKRHQTGRRSRTEIVVVVSIPVQQAQIALFRRERPFSAAQPELPLQNVFDRKKRLTDPPDIPELVPQHDRTERRIDHRTRFLREMLPVDLLPFVLPARIDHIPVPVRALHGNFLIQKNGKILNRPHILFFISFFNYFIYNLLPLPDFFKKSRI